MFRKQIKIKEDYNPLSYKQNLYYLKLLKLLLFIISFYFVYLFKIIYCVKSQEFKVF